jgi:hypothetical protein
MVAACTLAASICGLLLGDMDSSAGIMNTQLHQLCERTFAWPLEEDVLPERLSPMPKNIAKNFIDTFYKEKGVALVDRERLQVKEQVHNPSLIACRF